MVTIGTAGTLAVYIFHRLRSRHRVYATFTAFICTHTKKTVSTGVGTGTSCVLLKQSNNVRTCTQTKNNTGLYFCLHGYIQLRHNKNRVLIKDIENQTKDQHHLKLLTCTLKTTVILHNFCVHEHLRQIFLRDQFSFLNFFFF